jgi:transmembrane sensor
MALKPKLPPLDVSATDQAAAWLARQRIGPLSEADAAAFAAWLRSDPSHTAAWDSYERLWDRVEAVRDDPRVLAIREQARRKKARRMASRRAWRFSAALAAGVLVAVGVGWNLRHSIPQAISPEPSAQIAAAAAQFPTLVRDASTEIGERSQLLLPDGSKVTLNTGSAIHADYTGHDRRVILVRGEAFFDVAKDTSRPFIVSAGSRQVIAVGTAFDVRLQDSRVKVTLVEGKVRVLRIAASNTTATPPSQPLSAVMLEAGSVLVARDDGADQVERLDADRATSWKGGKLVFDGERLADVVAEMNRYSREKLEIADAALQDRQVSGVFEPTGGAVFAKALEAYGIAHVSQETATTIVLDSPR